MAGSHARRAGRRRAANADRAVPRRAGRGAAGRSGRGRDRRAGPARPASIPAAIDDVIFGCANQAGEDNRNVARMSLLLAGLPVTCRARPSTGCAARASRRSSTARAPSPSARPSWSSRAASNRCRARRWSWPRRARRSPRGDVTVHDTTLGWRFVNPRMEALHGTHALGETAELVAEKYGVTREAQDAFALDEPAALGGRARRRALRRRAVPPYRWRRGKGAPKSFDTDEHPRPETTAAELAALRPAFRKQGGTVTAGNSSGINDGAAAVLLASPEAARAPRRRAPPLARFVASAVAGVEPKLMGLGPIPATAKAARARRHRGGRSGSRRAERGVRGAGDPLHARARRSIPRASTSTAAPSRSATRWARRGRGW